MQFLPNPWLALGILVALLAAGGGGFYYGHRQAEQAALAERAKQQSIEEKIQIAIATEVSKIKVINTTKQQTIHEKTVEVPVYRDCRNDPVVLGLLNDLLTGKTTVAPGDRLVPSSEPARQ